MRKWPPILGLRNALTATLTYMRRNRVQAEIAENYGVSQPTVSRAISAITPLLVQALLDYVPTAHELDAGTCYIVDGTLLPCWSWRAHPELYSGKHKTTGMNVQVACTITGCLAWISDPISGSRHDNHCLGESGVLLSFDPRNWLGDKGYVGNNMITPFKKPEGGELLDWQKEFNKQVNKIRYVGSPYLTGVLPIRPLLPARPDPAGRPYGDLAATRPLATFRDRPRQVRPENRGPAGRCRHSRGRFPHARPLACPKQVRWF